MILITLGTQDKEFKRLLEAVDKQIEKKHIKEKVIVQAGYTKYESKNMEIFDLIPSEELEKLVKDCKILITHGGVGSILTGIKYNKPIIAAARLKKYKEHTNDHQKQIIKEFESRGYILELRDFNKLDIMLEKARSFKPKKFVSNTDTFIKNIEDYIKEDNHTSWFNKYRSLLGNGYRGILLSLINLLIFSLLVNKFNIFTNILISYSSTLVLSLLFNLFTNIKYNITNYLINNIILVILDIVFTYLFISGFNINIILSKLLSLVIISIANYLLTKLIMKENRLMRK